MTQELNKTALEAACKVYADYISAQKGMRYKARDAIIMIIQAYLAADDSD